MCSSSKNYYYFGTHSPSVPSCTKTLYLINLCTRIIQPYAYDAYVYRNLCGPSYNVSETGIIHKIPSVKIPNSHPSVCDDF